MENPITEVHLSDTLIPRNHLTWYLSLHQDSNKFLIIQRHKILNYLQLSFDIVSCFKSEFGGHNFDQNI